MCSWDLTITFALIYSSRLKALLPAKSCSLNAENSSPYSWPLPFARETQGPRSPYLQGDLVQALTSITSTKYQKIGKQLTFDDTRRCSREARCWTRPISSVLSNPSKLQPLCNALRKLCHRLCLLSSLVDNSLRRLDNSGATTKQSSQFRGNASSSLLRFELSMRIWRSDRLSIYPLNSEGR